MSGTALARWLYRGGRPNRVAAFLNGFWRVAGSAGFAPRRLRTLEVRGRRSGRLSSFPVMVADYDGERYLVAMLGEDANWVANVRAADGQAVLQHGRRESVRLQEVDPGVRAPILRRYLEVAPGARAHVTVDRGAPASDFERIAPHYPVFRIEPVAGGRRDAAMPRLGSRLGLAGGLLGVVAGAAQWAFGSEIPDWTGDKLHPVQLGIITIALSLVALASVSDAARRADATPRRRIVAALGILAPAGICFTTVGRLWYVPGVLLILAAALLLARPPRSRT